MRVALVESPLKGHKGRGTGVYAGNLFEHIRRLGIADIQKVPYGKDLNSYDLVHYPYFDPFFLTLPIFRPVPAVVTVHDLIPLKFPEVVNPGIKGRVKWEIQKRILQRVDFIITDSLSSREQIRDILQIDTEKICHIYLGVSGDFFNDRQGTDLPVEGRFILYVGDVNRNKNIPGLLKAFSILRKRMDKVSLVLAGRGFAGSSEELTEIKETIEEYSLSKDVRIMTPNTSAELKSLYRKATVYVQPSLAEGFGLSVLEAQASGCPVVSSDATSLPEICGQSCLLFDPEKPGEIADALMRVLKEDTLRVKLVKRGLENARKFPWEKTARETVKVYERVMERYRRR